MRIALWLMLVSAAAAADVEQLVARAQICLKHDDQEHAIALLDEALRENPNSIEALRARIWFSAPNHVELTTRYLELVQPLDTKEVQDRLSWLGLNVVRIPDEAYVEAERASLTPLDGDAEPCGPWRSWERPVRMAPEIPASGPLRVEAGVLVPFRHYDGLLRVAARLEREGVTDATCWTGLASIFRRVGFLDDARECLARARPTTIQDRVGVAACSLRVLPDPQAWWDENGRRLLEDAAGARESMCRWNLTREFAPLLIARREFDDLVALAGALVALRRDSAARGLMELLLMMETTWAPEEIDVLLANRSEPGARLLRAEVLFQMLQDNEALRILEELVAASPDEPAAWERLFMFHLAAGHHSKAAASAEEALAALRARGVTSGNWLAETYVEFLGTREPEAGIRFARELLSSEGQAPLLAVRKVLALHPSFAPEALPLDRVMELANEAEPFWLLDRREFFWTCVAGNHAQLAVKLLHDASPASRENYAWWRLSYAHRCDLPPLVRFLTYVAGSKEMPAEVDQFLRMLLLARRPEVDVEMWAFRLRCILEAEKGFEELPGAPYVLALMYDPLLQRERRLSLERTSHAREFRSEGLLFDLSVEGDPVLDDLAVLNPAMARLASAMRSHDIAALLALAEEDAALPWLRRYAEEALGPDAPSAPPKKSPLPATSAEAAREALRRLQSLDVDQVAEVRDIVGQLLPSLDALLRDGVVPHSKWPELLPMVLPEDDMACARLLSARTPTWEYLITQRFRRWVREGNHEALRTFLDGPGALAWGQYLLEPIQGPCPELEDEVKRQAARRPRDLRWQGFTHDVHARATRERDDRAPIEALLPFRDRNAAVVSQSLGTARDFETLRARVQRYVELREGDPRAAVIEGVVAAMPASRPEGDYGELVTKLTVSCATEEEWSAASALALRCGLSKRSREIDRRWAEAASLAVRLAVLRRASARGDAVEWVPRARAWGAAATAEDPSYIDFWPVLVELAVAAKDPEAIIEGIEGVWRTTPLDCHWGAQSDSEYTWEWQWLDDASVRQALDARLRRGDAPVGLWHAAHQIRHGDSSAFPDLDLADRLYELGLTRRWVWAERVVHGTEAPPVQALRDLLARVPTGAPAYGMRPDLLVEGLIKANRAGEAATCADLWAERCGAIDGRDQNMWGSLCVGRAFGNDMEWARRPHDEADRLGAFLVPSAALSASLLAENGLLVEARARAMSAASAAKDAAAKEVCDLVLLRIALDALSAKEAPPPIETLEDWMADTVTRLARLGRESSSEWVRDIAMRSLGSLYRSRPDARPHFVEMLLREHQSLPAASADEVSRWADCLRSAEAALREEAEADLRERGLSAIPLLRALRASDDPEVRTRIESILIDLAQP